VQWQTDGQSSLFPAEQLWAFDLGRGVRYRDPVGELDRVLWNSLPVSGDRIPKFDFREVDPREGYSLETANQKQLAAVSVAVLKYGCARVSNCPVETNHLARLGRLLSSGLRPSFWGTDYDVLADPAGQPANLAYTPTRIPFHTDLPYNSFGSELVQMLHCLDNADPEGGGSQLADGVAAAEFIREADPEAFQVLSTTEMTYDYFAPEAAMYCTKKTPVFVLGGGGTGRVERVVFNHRPLAGCEDLEVLGALSKFADILERPEFSVTFKMQKGDMVLFDNSRLLHGRAAWRPVFRRHLKGGYLCRDEFMARCRFLVHTSDGEVGGAEKGKQCPYAETSGKEEQGDAAPSPPSFSPSHPQSCALKALSVEESGKWRLKAMVSSSGTP